VYQADSPSSPTACRLPSYDCVCLTVDFKDAGSLLAVSVLFADVSQTKV
jgi:hypothetical protein